MPPEVKPGTGPETRGSIVLETPSGAEFEALVRLVLGGIAARAGMCFEELDDLQLAVERLLAEAGEGRVRLTFDVREGIVHVRVGPLRANVIAEALQSEEPPPGELGLRRVLTIVVDSFEVEPADDGAVVVELEKRVRDA